MTERATLDPLEPERRTFLERDEAGLCIDCGVNPQPVRQTEDGTHHRCDDCFPVYVRRRKLRERLCSEEWMCFFGVSDELIRLFGASRAGPWPCEECGVAFDGKRFLLCLLKWHEREKPVTLTRSVESCWCLECVEKCGYLNRLDDAKSFLQKAALVVVPGSQKGGVQDYSEVGLAVRIMVPWAVAGMAATGFELSQWLWGEEEIPVICISTQADELRVNVCVESADADHGAHELAKKVAVRLTQASIKLFVPSDRYDSFREAVYTEQGLKCARRLARRPISKW